MLDCSPIKRDRELGSDRRETALVLSVCRVIEVSSVAQYERNCHPCPMLKRLVVSPGLVGTTSGFVLTASKHKTDLTSNW